MTLKIVDSDRLFFTSDTHFSHEGILKHQRGKDFADVEYMNGALINRWNATVPSNGIVFHLGDFSFGNKSKIEAVLSQLNGEIHMIRGNHDKQLDPFADRFKSYGDYKEIRVDEQKIVMCHYPLLTWNQAHYGSWMLHGHSHHNLPSTTVPRVDVGVDGPDYNYSPVSFAQLAAIMETRSYIPVDHHA
jgi:calcineurin-like phosphoesterase family protein